MLHYYRVISVCDRSPLFCSSGTSGLENAIVFCCQGRLISRSKPPISRGCAREAVIILKEALLPFQIPPLVRVSGGPYERGRQHGRACGDLIRRYPEVLLEVISVEGRWRALDRASAPGKREDLLSRAMTFLPAMEAFAPHLVEEIRGIADGAKVSFAEALLVNVRAEVMGAASEALCTSFALSREATADGTIFSGQNLDQHPANRDLMIVLHVEPDQGPAILMCTFAGLVGYPGINSLGVSLVQNALSTHDWRRDGMPHYLLKRVLLEQQDVRSCTATAAQRVRLLLSELCHHRPVRRAVRPRVDASPFRCSR